jgi:hypothetical protein
MGLDVCLVVDCTEMGRCNVSFDLQMSCIDIQYLCIFCQWLQVYSQSRLRMHSKMNKPMNDRDRVFCEISNQQFPS